MKQEQLAKKLKKHELKEILKELDKLNKELFQAENQVDRNRLEETKEMYNSKYHG